MKIVKTEEINIVEGKKITHRDPKEIFEKIEEKEKKIVDVLSKIKREL